jgi:hypothetical protein
MALTTKPKTKLVSVKNASAKAKGAAQRAKAVKPGKEEVAGGGGGGGRGGGGGGGGGAVNASRSRGPKG